MSGSRPDKPPDQVAEEKRKAEIAALKQKKKGKKDKKDKKAKKGCAISLDDLAAHGVLGPVQEKRRIVQQ